AQVEIRAKTELRFRRSQRIRQRPVQDGKPHNQPDRPDGNQTQQRDGTEQAEQGISNSVGLDAYRGGPPSPPGRSIEEPGEAKAMRDAAREDDGLEPVKQAEKDEGQADRQKQESHKGFLVPAPPESVMRRTENSPFACSTELRTAGASLVGLFGFSAFLR